MLVYTGYIITNDVNYIVNKECNSITTDYKSAFIWKTELSAMNVLHEAENRKSFPLIGYHVERSKAYLTPINDDTKYCMDLIVSFSELYDEIKDQLSDLPKRLSECDRKLSDVEHFIEITDQNAVNGYKLYKRIKDLRIERRNIKRLLELKTIFDKVKIDDSLTESLKDKMNSFYSKTFSPREIHFDEMLK